jgi:hypothetical protein
VIKKADWVTCQGAPGFVTRVSKNGTWADVRFTVDGKEYFKRMPTNSLIVKHTISIEDGYTITDVQREKELSNEFN